MRRLISKKMIAFLLSSAMLLQLGAVLAGVRADTGDNINLLPNPDFEIANGTLPEGWEAFAVNNGSGTVSYAPGVGVDNSAALKISPAAGKQYAARPAGGDGCLQLESSTYYVLTYTVKALSDTAELYPTIRQMKNLSTNSNSRPWYELPQYKVTGTNGEFKIVTCYFQTDSDTTIGNVWLLTKGGEVLVDNISLTVLEEEGMLPNSHFERTDASGGVADWEAFAVNGGQGSVGAEPGKGLDGSTAARITANAGSQYCLRIGDNDMITLKSGQDYILTYWIKCETDSASIYPTIRQMRDANNNSNARPWYDLGGYKITGTGGQWKKTTVYFTTDTDTTRGAVWLIAGNGTVLIDDIELNEAPPEDTLVKNPGFERIDANGVPAGWEAFAANGGTGTVGTVPGAGVNGSMAAIIHPITVDYSLRTPDDPMIPVSPKTSYVLTYMVKGLSDTSALRVMIAQRKGDMINATVENPYYELSAYSIAGKHDDFIQVKAYFRTAEDAGYIGIWFLASGGDVLLDDVSLTVSTEAYLGDVTECNLSFEQMEGGAVKNWRGINFDSITVNNSIYRAGSQSVNLTGSQLKRNANYTCLAGVPVDDRHSYRFTVYVKSRNSVGTKISLKAIGADKNHATMDTVQGAEVVLSAGGEYSEWTPVTVKYSPAADVTNVNLQISVSRSNGFDVLVDDIRAINLDEVKYCERFSSLTQDGKPDDWFTEGTGSFTADGESLTVTGSGVWTRRFTEFTSNNTFEITGKLLTNGCRSAQVVLSYYDYHNKLITTQTETVRTDTDNVWTNFDFMVETGSFTYVMVSLKGNSGSVSFDDLTLKATSADIVAGSDWSASWIWYSEDYSLSLNKYRYFRDTFELSEVPDKCVLQMTADDEVDLWVNGSKVVFDDADTWDSIKNIDITDYLKKGTNLLAFRVINYDFECGLLYEALPVTKSGDVLGLIISDRNTRSSKETPAEGWYNNDYAEDGTWYYSREKGRPPVSPWGFISYDATVKSANQLYLNDFTMPAKAKGGQTVVTKATVHIDEPFKKELISWGSLWKRNTLNEVCEVKLILSTPMTEWPVGVDFDITISFVVPDFIPEGNYTLQIDPDKLTITNDEYLSNKLKHISITQDEAPTGVISTSFIEKQGGSVRLYIDGEETSPMLFYSSDQLSNYKSEYTYQMAESGLNFLALMTGSGMKNASRLWLGVDANGKNIYDFKDYDDKIIAHIAANPEAKLMVSFDASVPLWWAEQYPDEMSYNKDGSTNGASFASKKFQADMKQVISDLIDHITNQPYAKYISAFRLTAGRTLEWLPWSDNIIDNSPATEAAFREWLSEKYGTDAALKAAWNNNTVTLATATEPAFALGYANGGATLLDTKTQMQLIDYHKFLGDSTASTFTGLCSFVKQKTDRKWIVGGYFGYIWNAYSYEANGTLSTGVTKALYSDSVDFFSAPMCYDERQQGEDGAVMAMIDSLTANGKLYISENDIRTVAYQTPYSEFDASAHGQTYNMSDTRSGLIRDFSSQLTKGSGMWWYDMGGGWFNDVQMYGLIAEMQQEMTANLSRTRESVSEVAIFVDEDAYAYTAYNFGPTYNWLYATTYLQRQQLANMGLPYDVYYLSDLENGKVPKDYKINIILNSIEVDESEKAAIEAQLKKDGKLIIWNWMAGYSNGTEMNIGNISDLTGFTGLTLKTGNSSGDCVLNSTAGWCDGVSGRIFGFKEHNSVSPNVVIGDGAATVLGSYSDGAGASFAVKELGSWTSMFAAVPSLPAQLLNNIAKQMGVHSYSDNRDDLIFATDGYVAVHCRYGGTKTIDLPENSAVYDVFNTKTISLNTKTFTFTAEDNSATLFRLTPANQATVTTYVKGGGGSISPSGMHSVTPGGALTINVAAKDGYRIKSLTVDGAERTAENGVLTLSGITGNMGVMVTYERIPDFAVDEPGTGGKEGNLPYNPPALPRPTDNTPRTDNPVPTPETAEPGTGGQEAVITTTKKIKKTTTLNWPVIIGLICGAAAFLLAAVTTLILLLSRKNVIIMKDDQKICGLKAKKGSVKCDKAAKKCGITGITAIIKKRYVKKHSGQPLKFKADGRTVFTVIPEGTEDFTAQL